LYQTWHMSIRQKPGTSPTTVP